MPDLAHTALAALADTRIEFGIDLSDADLSGRDLSGSSRERASLRGAKPSAAQLDATRCMLCDVTGARLDGA
ncbi:pentapeptide repeat-containing protein, partial [Burkholderia pseudomallei]|uniref:pentapeptide repeat-containing protein n=1 Tax=Burkholderia pseudomallei TaxID=28450 RepID=UPI00158C84DB